jgi:hypothetical protein
MTRNEKSILEDIEEEPKELERLIKEVQPPHPPPAFGLIYEGSIGQPR